MTDALSRRDVLRLGLGALGATMVAPLAQLSGFQGDNCNVGTPDEADTPDSSSAYSDDEYDVDDENFDALWARAERLAADYSELTDAYWETLEEEHVPGRGVRNMDGLPAPEWFRREMLAEGLPPSLVHDMVRIIETIITALDHGLPRSALFFTVMIHPDDGKPRTCCQLFPRTLSA